MSYALPGMQIYPIGVDAPSGIADVPLVQQGAAIGASPGASGSVSYSASFNVTTAAICFIILYFSVVGGLHYLSRANDRL